jgi:ribosomal protein S18
MKIAIIMAGPYRGNESIIQNQLNMIGSYDTYVSCLEHYRADWTNSGWNIKNLFTTPAIDFKQTNWSKYRNDAPGQAGFWQFWNLKSVIDNTPTDYDWYIKTRCDLIFESGEITEYMFTTLDKNTLYCASNYFDGSRWDYITLLNDQFYIGDYNTMKCISEFVTEYYKIERHSCNQPIASNERNLRKHLDENNIHIKIIQDIKYIKNHNGFGGCSGGFQLEKI